MARMVNEMKKNFTVVHNQFLQDPELGIAERGLLMTMLSKPDSYDFSIKGLASLLPNGETAIRTALINLENLGYLRRDRIKDKGKFVDVIYRISDCPIFLDTENADNEDEEKPRVENPQVNEPHEHNPQILVNTEKANTEEVNTDETNTETAKPHEPKKSFAEKVRMTDEQYKALCDKHSTEFADKCIEELDLYKQSSGRTYKSDYHAILHWVVDKVRRTYPGLEKTIQQSAPANSPEYNPFESMIGGM